VFSLVAIVWGILARKEGGWKLIALGCGGIFTTEFSDVELKNMGLKIRQ
jgi:hypothetical protein